MELLRAYWSVGETTTNATILLHLRGALAVGVLTVINAWFGG